MWERPRPFQRAIAGCQPLADWFPHSFKLPIADNYSGACRHTSLDCSWRFYTGPGNCHS